MTEIPSLEGYEISKVLGSGGFGTTYLAAHLASGDQCVVKALSFAHLQDWKSVELFEREAQTLQQLKHPRIPRYRDFIQETVNEKTQFFLVQDYAKGSSLQECIDQGKHFTEAEVIDLALQITEILIYLQAHHPPFIHRDIKPENIIFDEGQVFLIDFGAVSKYAPGQRGSTMVGSLGYMAPEQFHGQAYPATDIYGLGVNLLYLLTHKQPSDLSTGGFKLKFRHLLQCSNGLAEVLSKMVAVHHGDRYTDAKALYEDLSQLAKGKIPGVLAEKKIAQLLQRQPTKPGEAIPQRAKKVLIGSVLLLMGCFIASLMWPRQKATRPDYDAIKQKLETVYEEAYRAEYGPPPKPVKLPE
jgi:serine/threonine protein kinase